MLRVDYPSDWEKLKNLDFEKLAKIKNLSLYEVVYLKRG